MEKVMTVDHDSRGLYDEACQVLGSNQKVIPQAGLSFLDQSAGDNHWQFLKGRRPEQGIIRD